MAEANAVVVPELAVPRPLLWRLRPFGAPSRAELAALGALFARSHAYPVAAELQAQGEVSDSVMLIRSGWCHRAKLLSDGRRQVVGIVLPGDFLGLRCDLFGFDDHAVVTLTQVSASRFPAVALIDLFARHPRLAAAFAAISGRTEAMLTQHVLRLGRMDAFERTIHLLLELHHRLLQIGEADDTGFPLPLTQELLADFLGVTVVHMNRTLRRLREQGLLSISGSRVHLGDRSALVELGEFDGRYLESPLPAKTREMLVSMAGAAAV